MAQIVTRWAVRLAILSAAVFLALAGFTMVKDKGLLSPFGIGSEGQDTQVIQAVTRTQEVSLLKLVVEGLKDEKESAELFGQRIPGTRKTVFIRYGFDAKLGINGEEVTVNKTGEHDYGVSIPKFIVIGYDKPSFEVATEDSGILSWATPDIDQLEMVNEVFNDAAQEDYLEQHDEELRDQATVFYDSLITSIDPAATTTFEFQD